MKKVVLCIVIVLVCLLSSIVFATDATADDGDIPIMTIEEFMLMNKAKQTKVDIIKKNNIEMENLKGNLKSKIVGAAEKINTLKIEI